MGQFFGSIYCLFEDFFGLELANYLWGQSSPEQQANMYIGIGLIMLLVSLIFMLLFYYLYNPTKRQTTTWFISLGINAFINFVIGWQLVLKDYYSGKMVSLDPTTNQSVPLQIDEENIICFGISNVILSIVAFIMFSYLCKWWSRNAKRAPF